MKTVVFGGAGFLGSHVVDALTERGHEVLVFDRVQSRFIRKDQLMVLGDVLDEKQVREAVKGACYVYHFAGIADIRKANENPVDTVKYNILGTTHVLDACVQYQVKRLVFASTIYVYSEHGGFYRSSKQACELLIENYSKIYGLNFSVLRFGSLYGRRANEFNFIHNAIMQAITEKKIVRKGDGNEIRDYVNVLDAAKACVDILDEEFLNSHVMITGTQTMKVREILEMIREMLNDEITIEYTSDRLEGHYEITPYNFRPRIAKKYVSKYYHDLGQGILDCIYDAYAALQPEGEAPLSTSYRSGLPIEDRSAKRSQSNKK